MNYRAHYELLMALACARVLTGQYDRHHVVPRCMGGSDDPSNIVELTPEEHYVAHQLLVKMHPYHLGLVWAAVRMARQAGRARAHWWLRRRQSESQRGRPGPFKGRRHTPETRAKMSATRRGRPHSEQHRASLSAAMLGNKRGSAHRGKKLSDEVRAKLSAAKRGRKLSAQHRASISAGLIGNTNRHGPRKG